MKTEICWRCKNFVRLETMQEVGEFFVLGICKLKMVACYVGGEVCEEYVPQNEEITVLEKNKIN